MGSPEGSSTQASHSAAGAWWRDPMPSAVVALGITQIISWGTTLYVLGVLARPIAQDTGWSLSFIFAGLSLGLIVSGLVSTPVGRFADARGSRAMMSLGSLLVAACQVALAWNQSAHGYLAIWFILGLGMRLTLYDAAFSALVQVAPTRGRRAIAYLTLFGGFASTIFWPISHVLADGYGWRTTLLIFAALNVLVCMPLNWWGLARRETTAHAAKADTRGASVAETPPLTGRPRTIAIWLFGMVGAASAFIFGAMSVNMPGMLEAHGLPAATAVALASLKGVAQVAGRVWEIFFGKRLHAVTVGRVAALLLPVSLVVLLLGGASFEAALVFTLVFGAANGLITIARGAVPLALFGPQGYGAILGVLATPYLILGAVSPAALALVLERHGVIAADAVVLVAGLCAATGMEILAFWYWRHQRAAQSLAPRAADPAA